MATKARQQYFADEISLQKDSREFSLEDNIKQKIDSVEEGAQVNRIETVKVNGTALTPDANKAVNVLVPDVIDNLYTIAADDALSAKQGKILYDYIQNLQTIGRFLSNWDSATGLPITNPSESPYQYKAGDYYRVSNVAVSPATNYKPDGSSYTIGVASTTVETLTVAVSDLYLYDGTDWILLSNSGGSIAVDSSLSTISTNPVENRVITNALNGKHPGAISNVAPSTPVEGMLWYDTTNDELKTYDGTTWVTEGTKMVVLEYGVSTWQDFIDAYNENAIVYCKVTSGSSGYRMAFMAYTAGQGTPTEVEFQYYRSRSSHSTSSTQLDEVYVYKLTNAGVWTTTQRDTGAEMIAGTGIGITFNSSGATINNTGVTSVNSNTGAVTVNEVPSVGTNGQVLTVVNGAAARANASGGDVLVSTQANNIFTPGMKIWGGTQSDFNDLTQDSNTAYLILADEPTPPPTPWTPGADTVAYREFDGDLTDTMGTYDGTPYNFTCNYVALPGNPGKECLNYSTNWGRIDVASASALADVFLQQQTDATFSIWWNPTTFTSSRDEFLIFSNSNGAIMQFAWYQNDIGWQNSLVLKTNYNNAQQPDGYTWTPTAGNRYNIIMTYDTTTKEKAYYVNGQLVGSVTAQDYKTASSGNGTRIYESAATGYMSNMIIEKKVWSAQDVSDYYDGTKADYGIS